VPVLFTESQSARLEGKLGASDVSTHIRDLVLRDLEGAADVRPPTERILDVPVIARPPCGTWDEAVADTHARFPVNEAVARELDAHEEDFFVRTRGESMVGAGIIDGSLVLMRPLPAGRDPRRGDIVLMQVFREGGECESTIKRWRGLKGTMPDLEDGHGDDFLLPEDTVNVVPVAVARGAITAF
jgi:SOS-response transcriptional repressor LexA